MTAPRSDRRQLKRLGQHFLHDRRIIERIIHAIDPQPSQRVVEIGPGHGALTIPLIKQLGQLDVIELDRNLAASLQTHCAGMGTLRVHTVDALDFDICRLAVNGKPVRVVGNLPYNISTPLLFHLLGRSACIMDMVFMFQKEVVERIAAQPGSRRYGRLSVMAQYHCHVEPLFSIGPGAFSPAPTVDSTLIRLVPHKVPPVKVDDKALFSDLVRQAFAQRRKTLRNALKALLSEMQIREAGVDPGLRAEVLSLDDFALLAKAARRERVRQ
ncbi:MAG: 16S rRNA (adenine(1518)-N(6)/adenine(1519)-N(6))-dimethyltransferase RsmA [Gammaproteobacteria bacterium]|nr:16S rRNA (adenine(1518)-N(6)/adenine(1519)-N(6))-dimethyltransferase RsmA [Gammaproteobacteria bacterium]